LLAVEVSAITCPEREAEQLCENKNKWMKMNFEQRQVGNQNTAATAG